VPELPRTRLILNLHSALVLLAGVVILFAGTGSAPGQDSGGAMAPTGAVILASLLFVLVGVVPTRLIALGLRRGDPRAWPFALVACLLLVPVGIGVLGVAELLRPDVRASYSVEDEGLTG
jgi:hypothetical protein